MNQHHRYMITVYSSVTERLYSTDFCITETEAWAIAESNTGHGHNFGLDFTITITEM